MYDVDKHGNASAPSAVFFCFSINDSSFVIKSINFVLYVKLNEYIFI